MTQSVPVINLHLKHSNFIKIVTLPVRLVLDQQLIVWAARMTHYDFLNPIIAIAQSVISANLGMQSAKVNPNYSHFYIRMQLGVQILHRKIR